MNNSVITLVFTDVVGSSSAKRAATLGADVSARDRAYLERIQAKHLHLVRAAVADHGGREIMTIGDSFFLTFEDPIAALRCTAAIQQRLVAHPIDTLHGPLRLRIGIHAGRPEFFENSWHGTDVDIAARAQSAASPQQIILTEAVHQLVGEPLGLTLRPLGTFALKGVGQLKLWDADYDGHGLRRPGLDSRERKRRQRMLATAFNIVMIVNAIVITAWHFWSQPPARIIASATSGPVNSIIIANFENKTGDPIFDGVLAQAFTIQLQQSPMMTVVSPQHLRQSLQYLGKSPDEALTPAIAQQIGEREGIKAYLTGSINKVGNSYLVIGCAVNTENGDFIASEEARSSDRDHVLDAMSTVATALRTRLGESLASLRKLDTPLGQATTPSLDAFRAYTLGDAAHFKGNDSPEAEGHYLEARSLDPDFAMAWARLGAVYWNTGRTGRAVDCITRAFKLSSKVSERERFYIMASYYQGVTGDLPKSIETMELACQTYPLETTFYNTLGEAQLPFGRTEEALASFRQAVTLAPENAIAKENYVFALLRLDRISDALIATADTKRADAPVLYYLHFLSGNTETLAQDIASAEESVNEIPLVSAAAFGQEFFGRYREAGKSWQNALSICVAQKIGENEATIRLNRLCGRANAGMIDGAKKELKSILALDETKGTLNGVAFAAGMCDQPGIALPVMADLARRYPNDTVINRITLPQGRAAIALAAHQPEVALHELEDSEPFDFISESAYLRGLAYLDLRDGAGALRAFQRATRYRGAALISGLQNYGQAQLGLARAFVMAGDKASAKKAYEALLVTWKDADADLPQLVAAKKEYAALNNPNSSVRD